jgi:hypothetical protein
MSSSTASGSGTSVLSSLGRFAVRRRGICPVKVRVQVRLGLGLAMLICDTFWCVALVYPRIIYPFQNFRDFQKFVWIEFDNFVRFRTSILDILGVRNTETASPLTGTQFVRIVVKKFLTSKLQGCTSNPAKYLILLPDNRIMS